MSNRAREKAINSIAEYHCQKYTSIQSADDVPRFYASDVFHEKKMQALLPKETFEKLNDTIRKGVPLDSEIATDVANAMKQWAMERGATHYTHWFQPLTGTTAEKHDSFFETDSNDNLIAKFSGKNLIVGESDASSFPSGGLRSTFEARGYTAWDPTSPAFIRRGLNGATLCIPTAFCSYTGEALDKKTPLLRSIQALNKAVGRMMKAFQADVPNGRVVVELGAEQEYFLIDRHFYYSRPDLVQTGRTLFGAPPPKHQQLDDHYYGAIKPRILAFMTEVEQELWTLGIPAKTRHNEVAPAQFELAPTFEELNLAVDHNMVIMEVLKQVAERHDLVCLLHEKPFEGINGSGKHNNWSIAYAGTNLLNPGKDPHQNAIFLTTLCAIIRAVDEHSDLLRVSTATAGNDHRLGANEAPPAIISIFLGELLSDIIDQIEAGSPTSSRKGDILQIGVDALPQLPRDATDRNRTSPFAFTGNKFEFRAPGSSQSCAGINVVLNTIAADSINRIADELELFEQTTFNQQLQALLQSIIKKHKRVIFNGNGYHSAWSDEAKKRNLPNLPDTPTALACLKNPDNIALFERCQVLSKNEVLSRYEVFMEEYERKVKIEGELSLLMARTVILPPISRQLNELMSLTGKLNGVSGTNVALKMAERIGSLLEQLDCHADELEQALAQSDSAGIVRTMSLLRKSADALEHLVADDLWPLPKYREMLFLY